MWKGSHVERITESYPADPDAEVDVESRTDRIGMPIEIQLDALPPLRISIAGQGADTRVAMTELLTAPLLGPPTTLVASMYIEGQGEPLISTLPIQPELGERLQRAQGFLLDPSSGRHTPAELAAAVLRLSELGFGKRASSLRSSASLIFGTETMDRKIASEYIRMAQNQKNSGSWVAALENIGAARALDTTVQPDWDQLEADVREKRALESLGAGNYDLARAGLLRATTVDPTRQQRLAPFITMSIEASDRATERQDTKKSRDAFLAIERERADAEAALARSNAARLAPATSAVGMAPRASQTD